MLALVEPGAAEARRPAAPLRGWRATAVAVNPDLATKKSSIGGAPPAAAGLDVLEEHDYNAPENQPPSAAKKSSIGAAPPAAAGLDVLEEHDYNAPENQPPSAAPAAPGCDATAPSGQQAGPWTSDFEA